MEELIRTPDPLTVAFAEALLTDAGIEHIVTDRAMNAQGFLGAFPCRILVDADDLATARRLMTDAGLGGELRPERPR